MEFKAQPGVIDIEFFLKVVDNALADVAEWSDIVGKNLKFDCHIISP